MRSAALRAELKPSRLARAYLAGLYSTAILVAAFWIGSSSFDRPLTGFLWIALSGLVVVMVLRQRRRRDRAIVALQFNTSGWQLRHAEGHWINWEWRGATVLPFIVVLRLVDYKGRGFDFPVWRDQLGTVEWRQLRVIATHAEFFSSNTTSGL